MSDPSDQFPVNFNIDELAEPKGETVTAFNGVCSQLDLLSITHEAGPDPATGKIEDIRSKHFMHQTFANGSTLSAHSVHGSDEYMEAWGEVEPIRSIHLETADGVEYEYSAYTTGVSRLYIKKPGERVTREISPASEITVEPTEGISVGLRGTPELMQFALSSIADRQEAHRLGLSKPTDGSIKEFTVAIQAALESDPAPTDTK